MAPRLNIIFPTPMSKAAQQGQTFNYCLWVSAPSPHHRDTHEAHILKVELDLNAL